MKIARWGIGLTLILASGLAAGQQTNQQATQQPVDTSLADAARRARDQKKDQAKPTHVWNDDNIPKTAGVSVVGETSGALGPGPTPSGETPAGGAAQRAAPENPAAINAELADAREHLQSLKTDLDIAQRKYGLDEQMYLSKPEYRNDKAGAAQLKAEQSQIAALQSEIAEAQKKVDELQAKLTKSAPAANPN
jgi:hypothetical protein